MQRSPPPCDGDSNIDASGTGSREVDDEICPGAMRASGSRHATTAVTAADLVIHEQARPGATPATGSRQAGAATAADPVIHSLPPGVDLPAGVIASHVGTAGDHVITAGSPDDLVAALPDESDVAGADEAQGDPLFGSSDED